MLKQFDEVIIKTTQHIKYLSAPPGKPISPHGVWVVVGGSTNKEQVLVCKGSAMCMVPIADVEKIAEHQLPGFNKEDGEKTIQQSAAEIAKNRESIRSSEDVEQGASG